MQAMESDTREPRRAQADQSREKSPAGSVKRARERAAAGLPGGNSSKTSPSSNGHVKGPGAPKNGHFDNRRRKNSNDSPESGRNQGRPSDRPDRSNFIPPLLNGNAFGDVSTPVNPRRARNYWEDGFGEGSYSSASRASTTATGSSTASIPDFPTIPSMPPMPTTPTAPNAPPVPPIPQMPIPTYQPPRRNIGPPPSARRGASSYYSQSSFVAPIPEEASDAHSSIASSHVIPTSWEDGHINYYMGAGIDEEDEELSTTGGSSGRESRAGDHTEESNLVKKGSPEKPFQPYMETLESGDESDRSGNRRTQELDWQAKQDERWRTGSNTDTDPIGRHNFNSNARLQPYPYSGYMSDATFLDSPRSGSPGAPPPAGLMKSNHSTPHRRSPSPAASPPLDPRVGAILGHLEKGGALPTSGPASSHHSRAPSTTSKGMKRPPRLNLDSPRQPGGRSASQSSLPELIRRATKLASNLDRGKTASRIGMLDILNANDKEKKEQQGKTSRSGSISHILAAFPSPSPSGSTSQRPSGWPSPTPHGRSNLSRTQTVHHGSSRSAKPRPRRCCGMPMWALILLLIILFLLIAAAVVIPVTLVVLPRQSSSSKPSTSSCQKSDPCKNGGQSIAVNEQCRCVCTGGWTGATCTTVPVTDGSCTQYDILVPGSRTDFYRGATLGASIPRLLTDASPNFSIPLSGPTIASLFSLTNLSCFSENAFVTFNQKSQKRSQSPIPANLLSLFDESDDEPYEDDPTPSHVYGDDEPSHILEARGSAQTSNNIIFAEPSSGLGSGAPASASDPLPSMTATAAPAAASSASSTPGGSPITQTTLDFARVAVLLVLQESGFDVATQMLDTLRAIIGTGNTYDSHQQSVAGNVTVDLGGLNVRFANGTSYGPKANPPPAKYRFF